MPSVTPAAPRALPAPAFAKTSLWIFLALCALSVLLFTELPILHDAAGPFADSRHRLSHERLLIIPHALCGVIALLSGPLQFSSRLRRRNPAFHRILGRVYVLSVLIAGPLAIALAWGKPFIFGTWTQVTAWIVCTLAAFLTARNRHIVQHRQWMIRSYAVTFSFITFRVPNPWPAYLALPDLTFGIVLIIGTFATILLADLGTNWRELTTRRA